MTVHITPMRLAWLKKLSHGEPESVSLLPKAPRESWQPMVDAGLVKQLHVNLFWITPTGQDALAAELARQS